MNWLQKISQHPLDDLFNDTRQEVSRDPPTVANVILKLYRGFDADMSKLERSGSGYVLSPRKCEQGALWFTHNLINGYDPIEYVSGRGKYILTYPLQCKKHSQTIHFDDGSTYDNTPQEILDKSEPTENCPFYAGYELPPGWFFSYKTEKFIICTVPITITSGCIISDQVAQ